MLPVATLPSPLHQPRQQREHRRRIPARRRRLARRQADLALRHRETRHRVHQQQHLFALIAKVLGHRRRGRRRMNTVQRRLIARRNHDHAALQAFGTEIALEKFVHFATTLTDQAGDDHVGIRVAAHHAQQHALADAGAEKYSQSLTAAARQQRIDRMNAGRERCANARPLRRRRRQPVESRASRQQRLRPTIDAAPVRIDHAAQQFRSRLSMSEPCEAATRDARAARRPSGSADRRAYARRESRRLRLRTRCSPSRSMRTTAPTGAGKSATLTVMPTVSATVPVSDAVIVEFKFSSSGFHARSVW